ncbi:MAG: hypothetical protein AB7P49_07180 [Bdellovibrionales bacterium]
MPPKKAPAAGKEVKPRKRRGGAKVRRRVVYIRKGTSPWNVYIKIPEGVKTIMGIDIGPRNLGLMDVRVRPYRQIRRYLWIDFFRSPDKNYSKASELSSAVISFVRDHSDWFSADLWLIEEQPALQADNVAIQQALQNVAQLWGKHVILINPLTLKTVLLPCAFPAMGHAENKMQSMALMRPVLNKDERLAIKAAILRQEAYASRYRRGQEDEGIQYRRYKSGRSEEEEHCWDDMSDARVFVCLALSVLDNADYLETAIPYDKPPEPGYFDDDVYVDDRGQFHVQWPDGTTQKIKDTLGDYMDSETPPGVVYGDTSDPEPVSTTRTRKVKPGRLNPRGIEPRKARPSKVKQLVQELSIPEDFDLTWSPFK